MTNKKKKENWKEDLFKHFGQRRHITKDCNHTLEEWVEELMNRVPCCGHSCCCNHE